MSARIEDFDDLKNFMSLLIPSKELKWDLLKDDIDFVNSKN